MTWDYDPFNLSLALNPSLNGSLVRSLCGAPGVSSGTYYLTGPSLPAGVTVSRTGSARAWPAGVLTTVGANQPRFVEDPFTGEKGLLLGRASTSLIASGDESDLTAVTWTKTGFATPTLVTGPDGQAATATRLEATTAGATVSYTLTTVTGRRYTVSALVRGISTVVEQGGNLNLRLPVGGVVIDAGGYEFGIGGHLNRVTTWPDAGAIAGDEHGEWSRPAFSFIATGTSTVLTFTARAAGVVFEIAHVQVEAGHFASGEMVGGSVGADSVTIPDFPALTLDALAARYPAVAYAGFTVIDKITVDDASTIRVRFPAVPYPIAGFDRRYALGGSSWEATMVVSGGVWDASHPGNKYCIVPTGGTGTGLAGYTEIVGLTSTAARNALSAAGAADEIVIVDGPHYTTAANSAQLAVGTGLDAARPKIISLGYPDREARVVNIAVRPSYVWTNNGDGTYSIALPQTWSPGEGRCSYAYIASGAGRVIPQKTSLAACQATEDSFYMTNYTSGSTLTVHLAGGADPTAVFGWPGMGPHFAGYSNTAPFTDVLWHGGHYWVFGRLAISEAQSGTPYYGMIRHRWVNVDVAYGQTTLMNLVHSSHCHFSGGSYGHCNGGGIFYLKQSSLNLDGTTATLARDPVNQCHDIMIAGAVVHDIGQVAYSTTTDDHLVGGQTTDNVTIQGNDMPRGHRGIVHWGSDNPECVARNFRVIANHIRDAHEGRLTSAQTDNRPLGVMTSSTISASADYSGHVIKWNCIDTYAPQFGGAVYANNGPIGMRVGWQKEADRVTCELNSVIGWPEGWEIEQTRVYVDYQYNLNVNPSAAHTWAYWERANSAAVGIATLNHNVLLGPTSDTSHPFVTGASARTIAEWTGLTYGFDTASYIDIAAYPPATGFDYFTVGSDRLVAGAGNYLGVAA